MINKIKSILKWAAGIGFLFFMAIIMDSMGFLFPFLGWLSQIAATTIGVTFAILLTLGDIKKALKPEGSNPKDEILGVDEDIIPSSTKTP